MNLSGNMTRQVEADYPVESDASHVSNIGRLVEDMELKMRNLLRKSSRKYVCFVLDSYMSLRKGFQNVTLIWNVLEEVYFGKAKDVVGDLRSKARIVRFHRLVR